MVAHRLGRQPSPLRRLSLQRGALPAGQPKIPGNHGKPDPRAFPDFQCDRLHVSPLPRADEEPQTMDDGRCLWSTVRRPPSFLLQQPHRLFGCDLAARQVVEDAMPLLIGDAWQLRSHLEPTLASMSISQAGGTQRLDGRGCVAPSG